MNIAYCASEVYPFAKTGGLADVAFALPKALAANGCRVKVFMPFYQGIAPQHNYRNFGLTKQDGVEFIFVKNDNYFFRSGLYGDIRGDYPDNLARFSFFSEKILTLLKELDFRPEIINANDWQTALVSVYLKTLHKHEQFFSKTKTVLTIHNLAYQGIFERHLYPKLGLPPQYFNIHGFEFFGKINLLKAGIIFSDFVNTVSPTYARQIQTPNYGCGLEGVLREKRANLGGILNALDYAVWDPKKDLLLKKRYSRQNLSAKAINKKALQQSLGLKADKNVLVLGLVTRLAEQKGIDILAESLEHILKRYQLAILGVGDKRYQELLKRKKKKYPQRLGVCLKFNEPLAHLVYAGSDVFLMPSRFEPCGLSQLIAYKYGTPPLVHATGGLIDTVKDFSLNGAGFLFQRYSSFDLIEGLERVAKVFKDKMAWKKLIRRAMSLNFSWQSAAKEYFTMYQQLQAVKPQI